MEAKKIHNNENKFEPLTRGSSVTAGQVIISLSLLVHSGFFVLLFLHSYTPDNTRITGFFSIYLVFALYNLIAIIGVLFKRGFGKTLCDVLIIFDFILNMRYPWLPLSLILSIIAYLLFRQNIKVFREKDDLNKKVYTIMAVALLIPVVLWSYPSLVPKLFATPGDIIQEAIDKNDVTICDKIKSGYRDDCIRSFAENKNDAQLCKLIDWDHERNRCYLHIGSNTKNPKICNLITEDFERGMCNDSTKT